MSLEHGVMTSKYRCAGCGGHLLSVKMIPIQLPTLQQTEAGEVGTVFCTNGLLIR